MNGDVIHPLDSRIFKMLFKGNVMGHLCCRPMIMVVLLYCIVNGNNHSELKWKSVNTEHFIINYYDEVEPLVYPTWKIAEEVYNSIRELYGYANRSKINITLADYDDYSNGFAEWTSGNVMIWLTDSRFELRGNTTWLRNVITHELTHIFSLETKQNIQLIDIIASISVSSPDETYAIAEPFSRITMYPAWFSEGIAQLESEAQGNDCWDTRRDMLLRSAVLDNKLLSLDEMGHFNHDLFGNEMVYNQGYSFTKHIERLIGKDKLRQFFANGSQGRHHFDWYFVEYTGYSMEKLYTEWRDSLKQYYESKIPGHVHDERTIVSNGKVTYLQKVSPNGKYIAYFASGNDDGSRTDLYVKDLGSGNIILKESRAHTACAFSPQSDKVYFVKSKSQNRYGSHYNDIYAADLNSGKVKRMTNNARVYDLALSSDGTTIFCVRYSNNAFNIEKLNLRSLKFEPVITTIPGESFYNVCLQNSDSGTIVVTKLVNGQSRLFVYNGIELLQVGPAAGQEESPYVTADGRIYYSADYDGIFNIYSINSDGGDLRRHTNTNGGYFSPIVMSDGSIIVSKFWSGKFSVIQVAPFSVSYTVDEHSRCAFKPLPVPKGKVVIKSHPYSGRLLRSTWEMIVSGEYKTNSSLLSQQYTPDIDTSTLVFGVYFQSYRKDALQKKYFGMFLGTSVYSDISNNGTSKSLQTNGMQLLDYKGTEKNKFERDAFWLSSVNKKVGTVSECLKISQSQEPSGDTIESSRTFPYASTGINFGGEIGEFDISGSVQAYFPMFIFPARFDAQFSLDRSFTDELSSSIGTTMSWFPFNKQAQLAVPFKMSWSTIGYVNEDFAYNLADYAVISVSFAPHVTSFTRNNTNLNVTLENTYQVKGSTTGLSMFLSLPVFKYGAFQVMLHEYFLNFAQRMTLKNDEFSFSSDYDFIQSNNSATMVFPIARTVNRTFFYYWDALYGSVGYSLDVFTNHHFFRSDKFGRKALFHNQYSNDIKPSHTITASLKFGHTKEYLFNKQLNIDFFYEILQNSTSFAATMGF